MKYVIVRCEDGAQGGRGMATLLEGAKLSHLQQLAQAGAAGGIAAASSGSVGAESLHLHRALFGLSPSDPEAAPGRCYAASLNVPLAEEETVWCAELVTQHEGRVVDPAAGRIPTRESTLLLQALRDHLGSDTRRWIAGDHSHHVLVARDASLASDGLWSIPCPEALRGQRWEQALPAGSVGEALRLLMAQASQVLEEHPVNRVRVDLGENPANLLWLWGAAGGGRGRTFTERTGRSGAVVSASFPMRGFAATLGLEWRQGIASCEEQAIRRLMETLSALLTRCDFIYVHVRVESADPVERLCAMERLDQGLLKPLTETLPGLGSWRLLVVLDDRPPLTAPFVAIGTGIAPQPIARLEARHLAESPLVFSDGVRLFTWFTAR